MNDSFTIDEFEVLESLRRKGIGKNIICQIQREFDKIELYPDNLEAKIFWERMLKNSASVSLLSRGWEPSFA